jgi:hypothetical protein
MFSTDGFKSKGIGLMAFNYPGMVVGISNSVIGNDADIQAQGVSAIQAAIADTGKTTFDKPSFVLITAPSDFYTMQDFLDGVASVVGHVPIFGGKSGGIHAVDASISYAYQYTRTSVSANSVLLAVVYGNIEVGSYFGTGHTEYPDKTGTIVSEGMNIKTINGQPCSHVYNEWLGGAITSHIADAETNDKTVFLPAEIWSRNGLKVAIGKSGLSLAYSPSRVDGDGNCFTCCSPTESGKTVTFLSIEAVSANNVIGKVLQNARLVENMKTNDVAGALFLGCETIYAGYPQFVDNAMGPIQEVIGKTTPALGFIATGEMGYSTATGPISLAFSVEGAVFGK